MDIERYDGIEFSTDYKTYLFVSRGPKGDLLKLVRFSVFPQVADSHNLALGTSRLGVVSYNETTDNGDRDKVLATIFHVARMFSREYPYERIFIRGRNKATTRLYRAAINHEYLSIIQEYMIYGGNYNEEKDEYSFEPFVQSKQYDAFLFERAG